MNLKISVIIPIYNVEKYLNRCIDSILNQTYSNLEIILVNDGSSDSCGKICDYYKMQDQRIKVIHKVNGGLSSARNSGLEIATGDYISFIDSDDFINLKMFEDMIKVAKQNNSDMICCKYFKFKNIDDIPKIDDKDMNIKHFTNIEALEEYFSDKLENDKQINTAVWNKIYKKEILKNIQFPVGKIYEDVYVTYKLLYNSKKVSIINKYYYYYFQRDGSIMNSKFAVNDLYSYDDWKEIFHYINEKIDIFSDKVAIKYIFKHIYIFRMITENRYILGDVGKQYKKKIIEDLKADFNILIKLNIGIKEKIRLSLFLLNSNLFIKLQDINIKINMRNTKNAN